MNTKLKKAALGLGLGFAIVSAAQAGVTWFPYPNITNFEDDNLDFALRQDDSGSLVFNGTHYRLLGGSDTLQVGDILVSVFEINATSGILGGGTAPVTGGELTGVAAVQLSAFADIDGFGVNNDMLFNPYLATLFPTLPDDVPPPGVMATPGGAIAAMWFGDPDPANNLDLIAPNCVSLNDCLNKGMDGDLFQVDGFAGNSGEYWFALNAETNLNIVLNSPATATLGPINFALSNFYNRDGDVKLQTNVCPFAGLGCGAAGDPYSIQVIGSGDIKGGQGLTNGAVARSDFQFQKTIPEPATLALFGIGLLGLGSRARRHVEA